MRSRTPHATRRTGDELQRKHTLYPSLGPELTTAASSSVDSSTPLLHREPVEMALPPTASNARLPAKASFRLFAVSLFFALTSLAWGYAM